MKFQIRKTYRARRHISGCLGLEEAEDGVRVTDKGFFGGDENILKYTTVLVALIWEYTKTIDLYILNE